MILLTDQDRLIWDQEKISAGISILDEALTLNNSGPYQIQAAIGALHAEAKTAEETDWPQISLLYGALVQHNPDNAIVRLNHAAAVSMADGPLPGLALLDPLESQLQDYYLFHAAKADMCRRAGWADDAVQSYQSAIELTDNQVERAFLEGKILETRQSD